ncbi:MAG TPA: hypothetical protein VMT62_16925 [Syntrophorhabdaceae bacterium]|nr:hypothetical protein [Syntrophorhabdaceae bacterium]
MVSDEHDHHRTRPHARAFFTNLDTDMPLTRKIWLIFRNNMKKILTLKSCRGHPGEPGC